MESGVMGKYDLAAYVASLPDMPLDELCARLRGKYPGGIQYGKNPLQAEAARRLEELTGLIDVGAAMEKYKADLVDIVAATGKKDG